MMTTLSDLLQDIVHLEADLARFETRFGVKSHDFYQAMVQGKLADFDALDEYRMAFIEWLALYKTWLSLNEKYNQLIKRQPIAMQIKANLNLAYA